MENVDKFSAAIRIRDSFLPVTLINEP